MLSSHLQTNTSPGNAYKRIVSDVDESPERQEVLEFLKGHNYKLAALPDISEE